MTYSRQQRAKARYGYTQPSVLDLLRQARVLLVDAHRGGVDVRLALDCVDDALERLEAGRAA